MSFPFRVALLIWIHFCTAPDDILSNALGLKHKIRNGPSTLGQGSLGHWTHINHKNQRSILRRVVLPTRHPFRPLHSPVFSRTACCVSEILNHENDEFMIEAAASHTCSSFSLLGVKSLGIDYGLVRTGIAITVGYNPKPLAILSNLNTTQLCQEIVRRVETENAQQIVVGLPLHKNGTVAEQTILTREFVQQLVCSIYASFGPAGEEKEATLESDALFTAIPIFLWDERYTSKEAEARLRARNPKKNFASLQGELDADAACIILEHFYADSGKGAERVQVPQHDPALLQVVQEAWALQCEERSELLKEKQRARQDGIHINAKQVAIERARILDAKLEIQYGPKKGKKKRRR